MKGSDLYHSMVPGKYKSQKNLDFQVVSRPKSKSPHSYVSRDRYKHKSITPPRSRVHVDKENDRNMSNTPDKVSKENTILMSVTPDRIRKAKKKQVLQYTMPLMIVPA